MSGAHKILGVGPRCAEWLRRQYPHNRGKLIARDFDVHENSAWRWLKGVAPTTRHLEEMFSKWGRPWLEFVFVEAAERSDPRLSELVALQKAAPGEIQAIEEEMRRLAARRAELEAAQEGVREERQTSLFQRAGPEDLNHLSPSRIRRAELLEELFSEVPPQPPSMWIRLARLLWPRSGPSRVRRAEPHEDLF